MKKTLIVLAAAAALGLIVVACSGVNPAATSVGGETPTLCDISGVYTVYMANHQCFDSGLADVVITQSGFQITVELREANGGSFSILECGPLPTGTVDCNGNFTVSTSGTGGTYGTPLVITGTINADGTITAMATCGCGSDAIDSTTTNGGSSFTHCDCGW